MVDDMNGLTLLVWGISVLALIVLAQVVKWTLLDRRPEPPVDEAELEAMERMRQILERQTGREIAVAYRAKGYWWAQTARGPMRAEDLLREGYVRVGSME